VTAVAQSARATTRVSPADGDAMLCGIVEFEAATLVADHNCETIGRLVNRVLRVRTGPSRFTKAISEVRRDARPA
jgi:hypothetical protein